MSATYCLHGYDWEPVAARMAEVAQVVDDSFLLAVAEQMAGISMLHAPDGVGCDHCRGVAVELCASWSDAQRVMLAWLMQEATR